MMRQRVHSPQSIMEQVKGTVAAPECPFLFEVIYQNIIA